MTSRIDSNIFTRFGQDFIEYLKLVLIDLEQKRDNIELFYTRMKKAQNIHIYGFGRSGAAALSLAIRLRHFCTYLPPVWWVGDQVRFPITEGDLVILFSSEGDRGEVGIIADKAQVVGADSILITQEKDSIIGNKVKTCLLLPKMSNDFVYGGGDFELAAYFLQELLVTEFGMRNRIPKSDVDKYHV
jgi:D-arabinose 5-phosphate isomerase GutQ